MENVVFEDVVVEGSKDNYYKCEGVTGGVAKGKTSPVPECFEDQTDSA